MIAFVRGVIARSIAAARDAEILRLAGFQIHRLAARVLDDVFERDPIGNRQHHFIAVVHQHLNRMEQRQLATGGEHRFLRRVVAAEIGRVALNNRLAHLRNAAHDGVARKVRLNRGDGGVFNVARRGKVRLARAKIDKMRALRAQLGRLRGNSHGGGNFNAVDAVGEDFLVGGNSHASSLSELAKRAKRKSDALGEHWVPHSSSPFAQGSRTG